MPAIQAVTPIFGDACRHTEAHSQPLQTLGVAPTIEGVEDWANLQEARRVYLAAYSQHV